MAQTSAIEAKDRILSAATQLFSQKGYDATRVNDIASAANVNKALIYYYFKSKEDILDYIVHSVLNNAVSITLDFIQTNIIQMIKDGSLDIRPDRLHFANAEAVGHFLQNASKFLERVVDYLIEKKDIIRVLMLESLKSGKHQNSLFRFTDFLRDNEKIFKTISDTGQEFVHSHDIVLFEFFFSIIPIFSFAAYFDDYKAVSSLSDDELRSSFLWVSEVIIASLVSGTDILLKNNIQKIKQ
ncbi:MAG: TetR/AcrR family transcriptional regulator [Oscillospiraceae bacterium]